MTAPFVEYAFLSPFYIFCFSVKNQMFLGVWIDIRVFDSVPLVLLSVLMSVPGCFQYCSSVVEFEVKDCDTSRSSLIVKDCFSYPWFFVFPYEVEYCSFKVCKEFCWDFDGHCIESVHCFLVRLQFLLYSGK